MSQDPQGSADFAENFHIIQPHRDPESNWAIDIAKNLEDYLLKFYSGDITGNDEGIPAVNFADGCIFMSALMVQGSVQVYSRKVEYLHSLVLHALETIKQQSVLSRQPEQLVYSSGQHEQSGKQINFDEFDPSCSYDDIEVDLNSTLDESATTSDAPLYNCVRPPPELAFLEGGFSYATGDSGELSSYLSAKITLYRDFLLLDPSDAAAVDAYYKELDNNSNNEQNDGSGDSSLPSKGCKGFQSPTRQSGGSPHRASVGMSHDADLNQSPPLDYGFENRNHDKGFHSPACKIPRNNSNEFSTDDEFPGFNDLDDADDDDDEDDPWKPLNPHEPGNLKVQPFRKLKVKAHGRDAVKPKKVPTDITNEFPLAPLHGFIEPSLNYILEAQQHAKEKQNESQSPTLYEKLRELLVLGGVRNFDAYCDLGDDNEDNGYDSVDEEFKAPNFDMPETKDIGFENSAGAAKHQAVALRVSADRAVFYRCQMDGYQDTLYTHTYRQFYRDCTVSGTIDFIFGDAAAVMQNCKMIVRKPLSNQGCMVTAQGRKDHRGTGGLILQNCHITAEPAFMETKPPILSYLGRPWKEFSRTIIMQSFIDSNIVPEGWSVWAGTFGLDTSFYAEYQNRGPGSDTSRRVKWKSIKKISPQEAEGFTASKFIQGDTWVRAAGVPYDPGMMKV